MSYDADERMLARNQEEIESDAEDTISRIKAVKDDIKILGQSLKRCQSDGDIAACFDVEYLLSEYEGEINALLQPSWSKAARVLGIDVFVPSYFI